MRFQVPQFIEIENKIVGPLTIKQFIYLAGGGGMIFLSYKYIPFLLALPIMGFILALSLALAFYKVNSLSFIDILEAGIKFYIKNKLYIWKREERKTEVKINTKEADPSVYVPKLSESKLKELSWALDIKKDFVNQQKQEQQKT